MIRNGKTDKSREMFNCFHSLERKTYSQKGEDEWFFKNTKLVENTRPVHASLDGNRNPSVCVFLMEKHLNCTCLAGEREGQEGKGGGRERERESTGLLVKRCAKVWRRTDRQTDNVPMQRQMLKGFLFSVSFKVTEPIVCPKRRVLGGKKKRRCPKKRVNSFKIMRKFVSRC